MSQPVPTSDLFNLSGRKAVIIGASGGLGNALAEALLEMGADAIVTARRRERLDGLCRLAGQLGRVCIAAEVEAGEPQSVRNLFQLADREFGRVDILVNAHGICHRVKAEDYPEDEWDRTLAVNLKSVFIACQEAGRRMIRQGGGKIINIASMLSFQGGILVPAYAASKGGVAQLTKAFANEWAKYNVQVNAIAPGYMRTELTRGIYEDPKRNPDIVARIPAGRWGEPHELKGAVVFLASAASDYVNGFILAVDGGWLSR
ncbi:MAG: SDR family oxidoreductase [Candidatus Sumerlaeia bacterium]|nr:SDR family oxidoreductase [Candidatus Sumerlaeia bacterium]